MKQQNKPSTTHTKRRARHSHWLITRLLPTAVVLGYVAYRCVSIADLGTYVAHIAHPTLPDKICLAEQESKENNGSRGFPLVSDTLQRWLADQQPLSKNLVPNATLANTYGPNRPASFGRNDTIKENIYQLQNESEAGRYLHAVSTKEPRIKGVGSGWVMDPVSVSPESTYSYSLAYRSNVSTTITVEYIKGKDHTFQDIAELKPSAAWRTFIYYYTQDMQAADNLVAWTQKNIQCSV
jgi:hypothetical protein